MIDHQSKFKKRIAIFDIDGTLVNGNTHIIILKECYYWFNKCYFVFKIIAFFFPKLYQYIINKMFDYIKDEDIEKHHFPYRESALRILQYKISCGYRVIIISNAPARIISKVSRDLDCLEWYHADINGKNKIVNCFKYDELFVVTDNVTDGDILSRADDAIIYVSNKTKGKLIRNYSHFKFMEE